VHTSDGLTTTFDLESEEEARKWLEREKDGSFQESITGLTISHRGVLYSFVRPVGVRRIALVAENVVADPARKVKGGERIVCYADDVRIGIMVHRLQRAVRVTLAKTGRQIFNPILSQGGT
jgi:hypothetical protein